MKSAGVTLIRGTGAHGGRRRALCALAAVGVVALAVPPSGAEAQTKSSFKSVRKTDRALIFRPKRVDADAVQRGAVRFKLRRNAKRAATRRVSARRIRRSLRRSKPLRVRRPRRSRRGKLVVHLRAKVEAGPPTCTFGTFSASSPPGACWRPYADTSPFNRGVGASPADAPRSDAIVERTMTFGTGGPVFTGGIADTTHDYGHPIYYPQPSDPVYTVHCRKWTSNCELHGVPVRIPAQARAAGGSDAHMTVIDQSTGWEYDMWETESLPPNGGDLYIGVGGMTRIDGDGLSSNATAAHFGLAAGVIRVEELEAGQINHALAIAVKCTNGTYVWPAEGPGTGSTCSSMGLSNENAPAMGQHFYLAMSDAEIDALAIPAWNKTVLRAIARYGMFVGDTGSSYRGWSIGIESGSTYTSFELTDKWVTLAQSYGIPQNSYGTYDFDLRKAVDWQSRLRVADPCVSHRSC